MDKVMGPVVYYPKNYDTLPPLSEKEIVAALSRGFTKAGVERLRCQCRECGRFQACADTAQPCVCGSKLVWLCRQDYIESLARASWW